MTGEATTKAAKAKKTAIQMLVGAAFGAGSMLLLLKVLPIRKLATDEFLLFSIGAIWAIIGVFVLFGSASPKLGAKLLNVADEEDLRDQRRILMGSSAVFLLWGGSHIIIALAGSAALLPAWAGVIAMLVALVACVVIYVRDRHLYDEFTWKLTMDASYYCFAGLWAVFSIWCTLSVAGFAAPPSPAIILVLLSGGYLLATFVAAGRAGLLSQK